jgi:ribonucleoside-diphosphate reductase alpha chain
MSLETYPVDHARRRKLPKVRRSKTHSIRIQGLELYMQCGEFEDGTLGEIFLTASKQGTILMGLLDGLAIAVSMALQYGTPLEALCSKFICSKFEPYGKTDDEAIPECDSVLDYIFRRLALDYLTPDQRAKVGACS